MYQESLLLGVSSHMWIFEIWTFLSPRDIVGLITASKAVFISASPLLSRKIAALQQEITLLQRQMPVQALANAETQLASLVEVIKAWKFSQRAWMEVKACPRPPQVVVSALQVAFGAALGIATFEKSDIWREMSHTSLLEAYSDHLLSTELSLCCVQRLGLVAETVDTAELARFSPICSCMFRSALAKLDMERKKRHTRPVMELMRRLERQVAEIQTVVSGFTKCLNCLDSVNQPQT